MLSQTFTSGVIIDEIKKGGSRGADTQGATFPCQVTLIFCLISLDECFLGRKKGKNRYQLTGEQEAACLIRACCFHVHVAQAEKRHQTRCVSCPSVGNEKIWHHDEP